MKLDPLALLLRLLDQQAANDTNPGPVLALRERTLALMALRQRGARGAA